MWTTAHLLVGDVDVSARREHGHHEGIVSVLRGGVQRRESLDVLCVEHRVAPDERIHRLLVTRRGRQHQRRRVVRAGHVCGEGVSREVR